MSKMGRNTKLTTETIAKLVEALAAGNYIETACDYAGISTATYYGWQKTGESEEATELHLEFLSAIKKARSDAEIRNVTLIQKAATKGIWQASAWWLERSHPTKWGRQQRITAEISGPNGAPIEVVDARTAILDFLEREASTNEA